MYFESSINEVYIVNLDVEYERERVVKDDSRILAEKSHQNKCHFTEMEKTIGGDSLEEQIRRSRVESELLDM